LPTVRSHHLVLALAALLAVLPGALALDQVVVEAPDVSAGVEGRTVSLDSTEVADAPAGASASLTIQDVDLDVEGLRCAVDPDVQSAEVDTASQACGGGDVTTTASADTFQADLDLLLPQAAPEEAAPRDAPLETESAAVAAPVGGSRVMLAAAAAGASLLTLYGAWRILKWTGLAALVPLYSHISDNEILDDPNRASIYRLIQAEPGISTKDVADRLHLAWGTVTHHLTKLEKRRFVVSKKYGKYRRYFANGQGGTEKKDELAVLRLDRTGDVAALIRANPGMSQKAVSEALGVSSSTILWHVKRLEEVRLVTKVREGKIVRYYPGDGLANVALISGATAA
jgi:DNA-binding transcriptional ArsR family regulator